MCVKRYLVNMYKRAFYHLKNLGFLVAVPLIILNAIIPILNYLQYSKDGISEELYVNILQYSQWFMPLLCVWWSVFVLRDYIEGEGNELLFTNQNRNKVADMFSLFLLSILNITVIFSVYTFLMPDMKYEYIKIISICVFYFGIVYCVSFITKSTTITLMLIILYTIANVYWGNTIKASPLIYYSAEHLTLKIYFSNYLPFLISGLILIFIGTIFNKKFLKLN